MKTILNKMFHWIFPSRFVTKQDELEVQEFLDRFRPNGHRADFDSFMRIMRSETPDWLKSIFFNLLKQAAQKNADEAIVTYLWHHEEKEKDMKDRLVPVLSIRIVPVRALVAERKKEERRAKRSPKRDQIKKIKY